jgi:ketosteroid isomerase-like protein
MKLLVALLVILALGALVGFGSSVKTRSGTDEQAIRALYARYSVDAEARNLDAIMSYYAPGKTLVAFDAYPPRRYVGVAAYRKSYAGFFVAYPGPLTSKVSDLHVSAAGSFAYAFGVDRWVATAKNGQKQTAVFRFTDVLRKTGGKWLIVHEHLSFPVDPVTGRADFLSKP